MKESPSPAETSILVRTRLFLFSGYPVLHALLEEPFGPFLSQEPDFPSTRLLRLVTS
jgi:hypothetical protein